MTDPRTTQERHELVSTESVNMGSLLGTTLVATCSCGEKVNVQAWAYHFDGDRDYERVIRADSAPGVTESPKAVEPTRRANGPSGASPEGNEGDTGAEDIAAVREALDGCNYHGQNWYEECRECEGRQQDFAALDRIAALLAAAETKCGRWQDLAITRSQKIEVLAGERDEARHTLQYAQLRGDEQAERAAEAEARAEAMETVGDDARELAIAPVGLAEALGRAAKLEKALRDESVRLSAATILPPGEGPTWWRRQLSDAAARFADVAKEPA